MFLPVESYNPVWLVVFILFPPPKFLCFVCKGDACLSACVKRYNKWVESTVANSQLDFPAFPSKKFDMFEGQEFVGNIVFTKWRSPVEMLLHKYSEKTASSLVFP